MPLTGFYVFGVGIVIAFLAFVFIAINMARGFTNKGSNFGPDFRNHIGGMIGFAFGGLVCVAGITVTIIQAVSYYG